MSNPKYKHIGDPAIRLIEECSELIKIVCKGRRFGWDSHYPDREIDNESEMDAEMKDVIEAYDDLKKRIRANLS